jgi:hypothetical protein
MDISHPSDQENQAFIYREANPILEPMMLEVIKNKPDNIVYLPLLTLYLAQIHAEIP